MYIWIYKVFILTSFPCKLLLANGSSTVSGEGLIGFPSKNHVTSLKNMMKYYDLMDMQCSSKETTYVKCNLSNV